MLCAAAALFSTTHAAAEPTLWQRASEPGVARMRARARLRAEQLFDLAAERRSDPDTGHALLLQSAALLELSGGAESDPWQGVLLGRALLDVRAGREQQAIRLLESHVDALPPSDFKAASLFDWGLGALFSGDLERAKRAFTKALALAWHPDDRANLLRSRGQARSLSGQVPEAVVDFRAAVKLARAPDVLALSHWGLGVALERGGDYRQGLDEIGRAVRLRLPAPPYAAGSALELPTVRLFPEYDLHYYRALGFMAEAVGADSFDRENDCYRGALASWDRYLAAAEAHEDRFVPNAVRHRQRCVDALGRAR